MITVRYHFPGHNFRTGPSPSCAPTVVAATCGPAMSVAMPAHVSLDVPFQLVLFVFRLLEGRREIGTYTGTRALTC